MGKKVRLLFMISLVFLTGYAIMVTVAELPPYGTAHNLTYNEVARRYIDGALPETGVPNMITSIVLDYRAYDTMFETTVLFTAVIAVLVTLKKGEGGGGPK